MHQVLPGSVPIAINLHKMYPSDPYLIDLELRVSSLNLDCGYGVDRFLDERPEVTHATRLAISHSRRLSLCRLPLNYDWEAVTGLRI
jgi:hypothetical protein